MARRGRDPGIVAGERDDRAGTVGTEATRAAAAAWLLTPMAEIKGVTAAQAAGLSRLEIRTVADLVRHIPMRYERHEAEEQIARLVPGQIVTVRGEVTATRLAGPFGRQRFEAVLMDETGRLDLVWFNGSYLKHSLFPGLRLRVHGQAKKRGPGLQLANPKFFVLNDERPEPAKSDERIRPVYPASEAIGTEQIERIVGLVIDRAAGLIEDHLPEEYRRKRHLPMLADAYRMAHKPESDEQWMAARRRLAFDELLLLQLGVFMRRAEQRGQTDAAALRWSPEIDAKIRARFPYTLTESQDEVIREIVADVTLARPSNRLIQGDVGSGKTVVALYAMLMAVAGKKQAALMAPTEILAEQHYAGISEVLKGSKVRIALLTGSISGGERERTLGGIASGDVDIVVGTHALLTEKVGFESLALVVVDEQHRFGVHQRAMLRSKGAGGEGGGSKAFSPHVLVMTATPIPRTLALTLFGDLDISTIKHLPPGRSPIVTRIAPPSQSEEVYRWVASRIGPAERGGEGDQAFVVVPAIDTGASSAGEGGDAAINDLRTVHERLEAHELKGKKIAALHGRMKPETRDNVMARFRAGLIDALVCTTIVEVGVDIPNATIMVIEHAERFGLAQLHQLRGRVGRGSKRSACILLAEPTTPDAAARVHAMAGSTDGFVLAEKDLEIRGPGEVFGLRQAGAPPLKVADLMRDRELLALARRDAAGWIEASPRLERAEESLLRKRLMKAHGEWMGLGDVG